VNNDNKEVGMELNSLLTMSKSDIAELISDKLEALKDGWIDSVDLYIYSKKLEYLVKILVDAVKDSVDSSTFGKDYVKHGVELSEGMTGVKYDFSKCGDTQWADLSQKFLTADSLLKDRQEFLKAVKSQMEVVDTETGETYTITPPTKTGKLSPIAKIK